MPVILLDKRYVLTACVILSMMFRAGIVTGNCMCEDDWTLDLRKGRCIRIYGNQRKFDLSCLEWGAELLRIEDDLDRQFLATIPKVAGESAYMFIGMHNKSGEWRHNNGDLVTWFSWMPSQPAYGTNQECMVVKRSDSMKMRNYGCTSSVNPVCMKSLGEPAGAMATLKLQDSCLEKHIMYKTVSITELVAGSRKEDCAVLCSVSECCNAVSYSTTECILYRRDPASGSTHCPCTGCLLYEKI